MKLFNQSIFVLGTTRFDSLFESTSFTIARYLAEENDVYYIENPYTWKDYFKLRASAEILCRKAFFNWNSNGIMSTSTPRLKIVVTPPLLSINFLPESRIYRLLLKINEVIISKRLKHILKVRNISNLVYINSFNFHYPNIGDLLSPFLSVYHCVDPLIVPFDKKHGMVSESILLKKSDVVICTSKQLYREKKHVHANVHFIPNAADIGHSAKALDKGLAIHVSLNSFRRPIIGYFGTIERRIDFQLVKKISELNPDKSFVFAGPMSNEYIPQWFYNTHNIYLLGRQDYSVLPALLKGFDLAIIPFKKDEVSAGIFPLKLFEYLGAGKPVIATNFNPDLQAFTKETVRYCKDSESFSEALNQELKSNSPEKIAERIAIAAENTWARRVNEFSEVIASYIRPKIEQLNDQNIF